MIIKVDDVEILNLCCASEYAFLDEVLDANAWISAAIMGKAYNCAMKMIQRWMPTLMQEDAELRAMSYEDAQAILNNPELVIPRIVACPSYKNRAEREAQNPIG